MSSMDDLWTEQQFRELLTARQLLARTGFPDITNCLLASNAGISIQALLTGSCLQMTRMYYRTRRDDSPLAKLGIAWIIAVLLVSVAVTNLQQSLVIEYMERFTAWQYQDYWLFQFTILLNVTIYAPTLLFFVRRAYYIWDRNVWVCRTGYALVCLSFIVNIIACGYGLQPPVGGFAPISNELFASVIPAFVTKLITFGHIKIASESLQLLTTGSLCFLTCYGIYRHRNGAKSFDSAGKSVKSLTVDQADAAVSKIAFVSGESLLPMFLLNVVCLVLPVAGGYSATAVMLMRPVVSISPAIYAHALLTALTSRERVRDILQAEPIREMAPFSTSTPEVDHDVEADYKGRIVEKGSHGRAPPPIAILESTSAPQRKPARWPAMSQTSSTRDSQKGMMGSQSQATAPLSPGGGTSTYMTGPLIVHADSDVDNLPASPLSPTSRPPKLEEVPSDPLIKNGAIVRPPLSSPGYPDMSRPADWPSRTSISPERRSDLFDGWRREQAALKRAVNAAAAAARGDRAWSTSAGQVPMPREFYSDELSPRLTVGDDGMDIFEVLQYGPPK